MHTKVRTLKFQITQRYGKRGANIANLCTAGYLELALIPIYEDLRKSYGEKESLEVFQRMYRELVDDLPNTIFVCQKMNLKGLIEEMDRRKKYGANFINIHGIGKDNIAKINEAILAIDPDGTFPKRINQDGDVMLTKIIFRSPDINQP